ncbi:MAG: methylamine utilization protein [Rhodopirellula sp.]|jgi:hypothetical protein|nr:methylamine utilization protein [Rhodopirellula sp.]
MINYAKHDEEFYGIFKLVSGEEILGKAVLTEDDGETIAFIQEPVSIQMITKEIDDHKMARGIGFAKWQQMSDDDFFILREKDIMTISTMSKEVIVMYEAYVVSDGDPEKLKKSIQTDPDKTSGYLGKIDAARRLFERIYKS